jgi:hypothetical protein
MSRARSTGYWGVVVQAAARRALRERMHLADVDAPIVGVVTRLTHQKGIHLIKHAAWRALERGGQFVLLGSAPDPKVQARASRDLLQPRCVCCSVGRLLHYAATAPGTVARSLHALLVPPHQPTGRSKYSGR